MFYNFKFLPLLLLFMGALGFTLKGAMAIKTGSVEVPIGAGYDLQGESARRAGIVFLCLGIACGLGIVALLLA